MLRTVSLAVVMAYVSLTLANDLPKLDCPVNTTDSQCRRLTSTRYRVEGSIIDFIYEKYKLLELNCNDIMQPEAMLRGYGWLPGWLPQFKPALCVVNVTLKNCQPTHYATLFAALNVKLALTFNLVLINTGQDELKPAHFEYLIIHQLTLRRVAVLHGLPASLGGMTTLTMEGASLLNNKVLETLPYTLTELRLDGVNIARVPAAVMDLPELRLLRVEFTNLAYWMLQTKRVEVERGKASRLRQLCVDGADAALLSEWLPPVLEEVTLRHWQAEKLNPVPSCAELIKLIVFSLIATELPAGWVAHCPRPQVLYINGAFGIRELPEGLLKNATQLTNISICHTELSYLPSQLFADTRNLTYINLRGNILKKLPSSMLRLPLLSLDLGFNQLNTSVAAELATFTELRSLSLDWNSEVGDLCAVNDSNAAVHSKSSLVSLSKLERLNLYSTGISVVCSDWREDLVNLTDIDLGGTNIVNVTYENLQYKRDAPTVVKMSGPIYFTADDYDQAAAAAAVAAPSRNVTLMLTKWTALLDSKCDSYWIAEGLSNGLLPLRDVQIGDGRTWLSKVRSEKLLCPRSECGAIPSDCYCGTTTGGALLRVICVGIRLKHMPQLQSLAKDILSVDLVLSNNSIRELVLNDLPPSLRVLDLRNNSISYMTEATARALVSDPKRRVLLAGNRLECSCRATPALRVLRDHAAALVGYDSLRCKNGETLENAIDGCWTLVVTASLPSVTAASLALYLWWKWRSVLGHSRALLWRLGWRSRDEREAAQAAWLWDAFVMFGRGDEAPALEVTAWLERGPRHVCLAERDWLPPALLSECFAESARNAWRTVALVSRDFECLLECLLEADEVQATTRRGALVLVLAPDGELEDATLRRYAGALRRSTMCG